ncbi:glycosyltransferase [Chloroflexales bacterium ZM16-3]|nr:glycosyltransferase [Chloroflexales bacterium ZM16-3]
MTNLLIISHDVVGSLMAGPGIRYWELARALAAHARVTLVAPRPIDIAAPGVTTGSYAWGDAASLAAHIARADVALVNGYVFEAHPELAHAAPALIIDLYDPTLLENLELLKTADSAAREARTRRDVELLNMQMAAGDFFLCATERQRDLYIGALMAAGRITPAHTDADPLLRGLIEVLPFGLPAEPPARTGPAMRGVIAGIGPDDPIILWSGGLWDWMDPQTLIRAMPEVVAQTPNARLVFLAGRHPGQAGAMRTPDAARALAKEIGLLGSHISFYDSWVHYERRADFLLEATVVVSLHRQHLETAYAALRSRVLDHLWVGLPSLLSDGDQAAAMAHDHDIGLVVPPEDATAVAESLKALLTDKTLRERMAASARAIAPRFAWQSLVQPIAAFLAAAPTVAHRDRISRPMDAPQPEITPITEDVAKVERERLLSATRNAAIQSLEHGWRLDGLRAAGGGRLARLRRVIQERLLWPLLQPLLDRQQEQNAAVLRALYAMAEQGDHRQTNLAASGQRATALGEHAHLRIDHTLQGLAELNERSLRERHLLAQQLRDLAEQIAGLEEADIQTRALLRGDPVPPPATLPTEAD